MNTETTKRYRLLKDISQPNDHCLKAGTLFKKLCNEVDCVYSCGVRGFHPNIVENNPEWFEEVLPVSEPVKEVVEVKEIRYHRYSGTHGIIAFFSSDYDHSKFPAIKQAIESALNDTVVEDKVWWEKLGITSKLGKYWSPDFLLSGTLDEVMQYLNNEKQSEPEPSSLPTKEWEILSFRGVKEKNKGLFTLNKHDGLYYFDTWVKNNISGLKLEDMLPIRDSSSVEIFSVKRLSDNTLWQQEQFNNGKTIQKFFNGWNGMEIHYTDGSASLLLETEYLPKIPPTPNEVADKPILTEELMYNSFSIHRIHHKNVLCDAMGCVKFDETKHK